MTDEQAKTIVELFDELAYEVAFTMVHDEANSMGPANKNAIKAKLAALLKVLDA